MTKRELITKVSNHIIKGGVVLCDKTKSISNGGLHHLSVGKYQTAVYDGKGRWATISAGKRTSAHFISRAYNPEDAARTFISFCGVDRVAHHSRWI